MKWQKKCPRSLSLTDCKLLIDFFKLQISVYWINKIHISICVCVCESCNKSSIINNTKNIPLFFPSPREIQYNLNHAKESERKHNEISLHAHGVEKNKYFLNMRNKCFYPQLICHLSHFSPVLIFNNFSATAAAAVSLAHSLDIIRMPINCF
jgi:hypothetical protein